MDQPDLLSDFDVHQKGSSRLPGQGLAECDSLRGNSSSHSFAMCLKKNVLIAMNDCLFSRMKTVYCCFHVLTHWLVS